MLKSMIKRSLMAALIALTTTSIAWAADGRQITGAGSSFIYPAMVKWTTMYNKVTKVKINYQSIGSGGGMRQLQARTIDFAASDEPLSPTKLRQQKWEQYPMLMGGIVPIINMSTVKNGQLVLSGTILADIYLGQIRYWDAAKIKALNPELTLPHRPIVVIHRSDGSGTTYNFTYYLSQVNPVWKQRFGYNTTTQWPTGIGGKGNAGVAAQVSHIPGSIGYVEYAYMLANPKLVYVSMKNASGATVHPSLQSFKAGIKADKHHSVLLANPAGAKSWPILATTFIMLPKSLSPEKRQRIEAFMIWCYKHGGPMVQSLGYVPLPATTYEPIIAHWQSIKK